MVQMHELRDGGGGSKAQFKLPSFVDMQLCLACERGLAFGFQFGKAAERSNVMFIVERLLILKPRASLDDCYANPRKERVLMTAPPFLRL